ncbi:reverse transcriptase domain-containing protein [Niallia sp. FSL W8-1348]|uniref:reverse transcriptase domain-containing protein n=1 Tax=Niallia sp. FSL W8-1348 TaxID=2954656 RepID=UPI0030FC928E
MNQELKFKWHSVYVYGQILLIESSKQLGKKNGKQRPLRIPNVEDRIVQQAIVNVLEPKYEEFIFRKWSCGYRPNLGAKESCKLLHGIWRGYNYMYDCDIKGYFDNSFSLSYNLTLYQSSINFEASL